MATENLDYLDVNINQWALVKLTQAGEEIHRKYYSGLGVPYHQPRVIDGFWEFQLWELMLIFGSEMVNGNPDQMFVDNRVRIIKRMP
jgi:hypothetical protein